MAHRRLRLTRRAALLGGSALLSGVHRAGAFGGAEAFHARLLSTGGQSLGGERTTAPSRWAWELVRRTSAPGRLSLERVLADEPKLLAEPFLIWAGEGDIQPLAAPELRGLRQFIKLGGVLVVDDTAPGSGAFGKSARRELARVLPESPVVRLPERHVVYKSYYIIDRPVGRVLGSPYLEAIVHGGSARVLFSDHDLTGALARTPGGGWALPVEPRGPRQRELAVRLAVNIAMYVLCSDYKDDQVHAPWLMRRRAGRP